MQDMDWQEWRHHLHQHPELSFQEVQTAARIKQWFSAYAPDEMLENLGGSGMAMIYHGVEDGPVTLIRCELDALPIQEKGSAVYRSSTPGVAHLCGHDGHMAMVCAVGAHLSVHRPQKGKVVLLFQPAEETGEGAIAVANDPQFAELQPDYAFALHNYPGLALGEVAIKAGTFNCASAGMIVHLDGKTSHAAHPENGISPTLALSELLKEFPQLPAKVAERSWVTVIHANLGEIAFGTSPGHAVLMVTLRSESNQGMAALKRQAEQWVKSVCTAHQLGWRIDYQDVFQASVNSAQGVLAVEQACKALNIPCHTLAEPMRWSEDFGEFTRIAKEGAMFVLGSGEHYPQLHNEHYDFPDALLPVGSSLFIQLLRDIHQLDLAEPGSKV